MSAKSARSARSGRFVSRPLDDPTGAPQKRTPARDDRHPQLDAPGPASSASASASAYVSAAAQRTVPSFVPPSQASLYVAAHSPPLRGFTSLASAPNGTPRAPTPPSAGRPPTKISLEPNGTLHQTTNGVITEIQLCDDDVAAISNASAAAFDTALTEKNTPAPKEKDKRVLRSQGGSSRPKSSLARFFPDFEEVVFGLSREPELLTADSVLFIVDKRPPKALDNHRVTYKTPEIAGENVPDNNAPSQLHQTPVVAQTHHRPRTLDGWPKVDTVALQIEAEKYDTDPLSESFFLKPHKRGERKEKQLRNIEKEHALHEKSDLERVLAELKGPDWLRVMGISGITETEKKMFEAHRNQYVIRVKALLNKFTAWKEQEKELKLKREEAIAAKEEADDDDGDEEHEKHHNFKSTNVPARQLKSEVNSSTRMAPKIKLKPSKPALPEPPFPEKVFESFYSKPYLRAAALSNHRRGRTVTAFGLPLPDMDIQEFSLPDDIMTEEMIVANARKRRRLKREGNVSDVK